MIKGLRSAWERVSIYLPVMLMGLFALGTYWLVRSTPLLMPTEPAAPMRHAPDYFMRKFSVKTFDGAGRLKSEVFGEEAHHFPDTDTLEIDGVRIRAFDGDGRLTIASARRALSNSDSSEVQLFGDARVVREATPDSSGKVLPRMEFRGEFLHVFVNTERIKSHLPVELIRAKDRFTANTMTFDNHDRVLRLDGRVKGQLVPEITP